MEFNAAPSRGDVAGSAATDAMHHMLGKYARDFPSHNPSSAIAPGLPLKDKILVTGASSGLRFALLSLLSEMPEVEKVYAIDAEYEAPLRQEEAFTDRGYDGEAIISSSRIQFLKGDLRGVNLGLPQDIYDEIRDSITHIIHIPCSLDALKDGNIELYEDQIKGLRSLVDTALLSPLKNPPRIVFVSSYHVLRNVDRTYAVKEEFIDAELAVGSGYSESLWVSEQLLALSSRLTPLLSLSVRTSQIAGTKNGSWDTQEWLPSLIKSSVNLGCFPMFSESVSWIGDDAIARALLEARNTPSNLSPVHLAHPRPLPWKTLFNPLIKKYGLQPVTFAMWYKRLVQSAAWSFSSPLLHGAPTVTPLRDSAGQDMNPALGFIEFLGTCNDTNLALVRQGKYCAEAMGLPCLDVKKCRTMAAKASLSSELLKPLAPADTLRWIAYWEKVAFLPRTDAGVSVG